MAGELHNYDIQHSNVLEDFVLRRHVVQVMGRARVNTNLEMHVLPQGRLRICRFDYKSISLSPPLACCIKRSHPGLTQVNDCAVRQCPSRYVPGRDIIILLSFLGASDDAEDHASAMHLK